MKELISRIKNWWDQSSRWRHFLYAIPCGFISILFAIGLATGMEFKDAQWGGSWDWIDWCLTVLGGAIGQVLAIFVLTSILTGM